MEHRDHRFRFDRMEAAGALGDLGTLIPLVAGMILVNGLQATNVVIAFGAFYLLAGAYFGVPVAVQPMKVIAATSIALGLTPPQVAASGLWMALSLLVLGTTGLIEVVRRITPKSVIRGVQLAVGVALLIKGLELMIDPDPRLAVTAAFGRAMPNFFTDQPRPPVAGDVTVYHAQPHGNRDPLRRLVRPELYVDISEVLAQKRAMLACHHSQKTWLDQTQGMDSYLNTMEDLSREVGRLSGRFAAAEGWRRRLHLGFCEEAADPLAVALRENVSVFDPPDG